MEYHETTLDEIESMNITDYAKYRFKSYFWKTIEHNKKFKKLDHDKK